MTAPFQHSAQLTGGSVAEAIMNTPALGNDGHFFTVPQGQVTRLRIASIDSEQAAGVARFRIREDATVPGAVAPVLDTADNIVGLFAIPLGASGINDVGAQPFELGGGVRPEGTNYYITVEQPGGAGFALILLGGTQG